MLAAEGPVFSSGHDFADVAGRDLAGMRELLRLCTDLMRTIQSAPISLWSTTDAAPAIRPLTRSIAMSSH